LDNVVGATVVLADGRIIKTDRNTEPDLFWAIRGELLGIPNLCIAVTYNSYRRQQSVRDHRRVCVQNSPRSGAGTCGSPGLPGFEVTRSSASASVLPEDANWEVQAHICVQPSTVQLSANFIHLPIHPRFTRGGPGGVVPIPDGGVTSNLPDTVCTHNQHRFARIGQIPVWCPAPPSHWRSIVWRLLG
jgi:hypothetical protein